MFSFFQSKSDEIAVGLQLLPDAVILAIPSDEAACKICVQPSSPEKHSETLKALVSEHKLTGASVNLVLSPKEHKAFLIERPSVPFEEQADAAKWRVRDMLDYPIEDAVVGAFEFPQEALRGRGPQLNVRVAHRQDVQHAVDVIREADLEPAHIITADLALASVVNNSDSAQPIGSVLLYLGSDYGLFLYVREQQLYLAREFEFPFSSLTELSQQEQRLTQLTLEIQRSFDYLESQMGLAPPKKMSLSAPDARLPLANMIGGALGVEVENFSIQAEATGNDESSPHAIVQQGLFALGAANNKLEPEHCVELYTEQFQPPRKELGLPHVAASLVVAIILVVAGAVWQNFSLDAARQTQRDAQAYLETLRQDLALLSEQESQLVIDPALKKKLEVLKRESSAYRSLLEELSSNSPDSNLSYSAFLEALARHRPEKLWLTKFALTSSDRHMSIEGVTLDATTIPDYLEGLQTEELFAAKTFGALDIVEHEDSEGHYIFGLNSVTRVAQ